MKNIAMALLVVMSMLGAIAFADHHDCCKKQETCCEKQAACCKHE